MNILSEPLVNYVILFSFQFFFHYRDLQFITKNCDSQLLWKVQL